MATLPVASVRPLLRRLTLLRSVPGADNDGGRIQNSRLQTLHIARVFLKHGGDYRRGVETAPEWVLDLLLVKRLEQAGHLHHGRLQPALFDFPR